MADDNKDFDGIKYRGETPPPAIFNLLFYSLIIFALLFMGYYLFSGWSSEGEFAERKKAQEAAKAAVPAPSDKSDEKTDPAQSLAAGKKVYAERCAVCHGPEGKGGIGPDLTKKDLKYGKTDEALEESIEKGRPGGMPGFAGQISKEQVKGLVGVIQSL
jgi:cytochrome c oxidase cbb3-type subunit 3